MSDKSAIYREAEQLSQQLEQLTENENWEEYAQLVNQNQHLIPYIDRQYWQELFNSGKHREISFWINYKDRRLTLSDLYLINPENDDLFYYGLTRPDLDIRESEEILNLILEHIEEIESPNVDPMRIVQEEQPRSVDVYKRRFVAIANRVLPSDVKYVLFDFIASGLTQGLFTRFSFESQHQWIPHREGNHIASFYGNDGIVYLAEVRYNQSANQILPP